MSFLSEASVASDEKYTGSIEKHFSAIEKMEKSGSFASAVNFFTPAPQDNQQVDSTEAAISSTEESRCIIL